MIDAITSEVIRHKLWSICQEQAVTLRSVSGSSVVTESSDFNNGIYLPDGSIVIFGSQMLVHAGTMTMVLCNVIKDCLKDPGIENGDMFITNDPYRGAVHLNDVSVMAPYFHKGEIIAWFGSCAHQLDVGGMEASSWCPKATERFQEGLIIAPLKIVEKGKTRKDLVNMILANTRLPFLVGLDIHALIASNNVAKKRFSTIVEKFGADSVMETMHMLLDQSEKKLRQKLLKLPDGTYRAQDFLDEPYSDNIYKIMVTLTKEKDTLSFDFTGSSSQAPNSINCAESTTAGFVISGVLSCLGYDITWNEGIKRPLNLNIPLGTVCNARFPAATGLAPAATGPKVSNVVTTALFKLLACSEDFRQESGGLTSVSWIGLNLAGRNQYDEPFGSMFLDVTGGSGAYSGRDGFGPLARGNLRQVLPDIENNENIAPILYLYRRHLTDSGGPGQFRGARSLGAAVTPHDTNALVYVLICHGQLTPNASGLFGGFPGACNLASFIKNSDIRQRQKEGNLSYRASALSGLKQERAVLSERHAIKPGDVLEFSQQGGGGWGSPQKRSHESVLEDITGGIVSEEAAIAIYGLDANTPLAQGVISDDNILHLAGVPKHQGPGRLTGSLEYDVTCPGDTPGRHYSFQASRNVGPYLSLAEADGYRNMVCQCGKILCRQGENWKLGAMEKVVDAASAGPWVKLHPNLEIREYICPSCGLLLWVDIQKRGEPALFDIDLK